MSWRKTYDGQEPQRVNKWLAQSGVCSRREAEALIAGGLVWIDGVRVVDLGRKIAPGETLTIEGAAVAQPTFVVNKPPGYVSAQPEPGQVPAARLLTGANQLGLGEPPPTDLSLAPLGRLDFDSRGLLLLSQDGVLAKALIGPDSRLDKEYRVTVRGELTDLKLALLRHGLRLDGRELKPAKVSVGPDARLRFVLNEGRYRQIRRMCEAVDLEVADLQRVRIGPLQLDGLPEGRWRMLSTEERNALLEASEPGT